MTKDVAGEKRAFEKMDLECMIADAVNMMIGGLVDQSVVVDREFLVGPRYAERRRAAVEAAVKLWWKE